MNMTTMGCTDTALPEDATGRSSDSDELRRRLAGYGISALAITGALVASAAPASAQIVATTLNPPLTLFPSEDPGAIVLDFNAMTAHYAFTGSSPVPGKFALVNESFTGVATGFTRTARIEAAPGGLVLDSPFGSSTAKKFARGSLIPAGFSSISPVAFLFGEGPGTAAGNFQPGSSTNRGFLGLVFHLGSTNPTTYFGWADIGVNSDSGLTLYAFGYNATNSTGEPFDDPVPAGAGEAPDASPLALLLLGGFASMAAYRVQAGRHKGRAAVAS